MVSASVLLLFVVGGGLVVALAHGWLARLVGVQARWVEGVAVAAAICVLALVAAGMIETGTSGRGAVAETLPWLFLGLLVADGLWLFMRGRGQASASRRPSGLEAERTSNAVPEERASQGEARRPEPRSAEHGVQSEPAAKRREPAVEPPAEPRTIFLSYRRADSAATTGRISDHLFQSFGRESVLKDVDSVPLGVDFRVYVDSLVSRCDILIAVIGRSWSDAQGEDGSRRLDDPRDLVRLEVEAALQRDIPVIPVLVDGAELPEEAELPESLRPLAFRNGIPVRADPDFTNDMKRLIAGLEAHLGGSSG